MDGEPVDLRAEYGRWVVYRWEHRGAGPWDVAYADVGCLADGRWYADRTGIGPPRARAFPTEESALDAARVLMADREGWVEVEPHPPLLRPRGS
jgi:hypothetical protein